MDQMDKNVYRIILLVRYAALF